MLLGGDLIGELGELRTAPAPMYGKPRHAIGGRDRRFCVTRCHDLCVKRHIAFIRGGLPCDCHPPFVPR